MWTVKTHGQQSYWLDIGAHTAEKLKVSKIIAHLEPNENRVVITPFLKIFVNREF